MNKNKLTAFLASISLALALAVGPVIITGCSTAARGTYQTVATTQVTVSTAMTMWGAYVTAQKSLGKPVPVAAEQKVLDAYIHYQKAMVAVCDAGAIYAAASTTNAAGSTGFAGALQQAVANANNSIADLEALIASFGVKLQ